MLRNPCWWLIDVISYVETGNMVLPVGCNIFSLRKSHCKENIFVSALPSTDRRTPDLLVLESSRKPNNTNNLANFNVKSSQFCGWQPFYSWCPSYWGQFWEDSPTPKLPFGYGRLNCSMIHFHSRWSVMRVISNTAAILIRAATAGPFWQVGLLRKQNNLR